MPCVRLKVSDSIGCSLAGANDEQAEFSKWAFVTAGRLAII